MSRRPSSVSWDDGSDTVPDQPRAELTPLPRERAPRHTPMPDPEDDEQTLVRIRLRTSRTLLAVIWD
jgi:hypothetical protein